MPATRIPTMNDKDNSTIPFCVFEAMADRQSLTIKRLWIMCILLIILLVGTNAMWIWYESQWEYYEQEVEQEIEAEGDFTVIGIGDYHGKSEADSKDETQNETGGR